MNDTLRRRGPDDSGHFVQGGVGLAMRRLSIIDIHGSRQPIWSWDNRYVGVFNGEIYNYRELRSQLTGKGLEFRTHGDGEVVLNLFADQGIDGFRRLRGMFAVAIWDSVERKLTIARDPLGIKPLFYSEKGGKLVFGSEMKAVLASGYVDKAVDAQGLDAFLAYTYIPAPVTIYRDIRKLEPGTCITWQTGSISRRRYWFLPDEIDDHAPSVESLAEAVTDSVQAHMVSDVPVGAFLSGGVDSSAIVARMQDTSRETVRAYTVRFDETDSHLFDETPYARQLQRRYGFDLCEQRVSLNYGQSLRDGIRAFDEPFADDSILPTYEISRVAAEDLKVCMSGAGGDELFGGYNRYQGLALQRKLNAMLPRSTHRPASATLRLLARFFGLHSRRGDLVQRFARALGQPLDDAYASFVTSVGWQERNSLYRSDTLGRVDPDETIDLVRRHLDDFKGPDRVKAAMYADTQTYLPEDVLALSDRIGMWHSLEIRVPLADKELATLAFSFPSEAHVTARAKKKSLRAAVGSWVPPSVLSHPKQGFESPTAAWLRESGVTTCRGILDSTQTLWGEFLEPAAVKALFKEHESGQRDRAKIVFSILVFAIWLELGL